MTIALAVKERHSDAPVLPFVAHTRQWGSTEAGK